MTINNSLKYENSTNEQEKTTMTEREQKLKKELREKCIRKRREYDEYKKSNNIDDKILMEKMMKWDSYDSLYKEWYNETIDYDELNKETKINEIKETIVRKTEEAWKELLRVTDFYGAGSAEASNARAEWYTLDTLYIELFGDKTNN